MLPIPQISIQTQPARLHIDGDLGKYDMRQPRPTFELKQIPASMNIEQPAAIMDIDQSRAWDALGLANHLEVMSRIYAQSRQVALEEIGRIAGEGDRLANITGEPDAIANMAREVTVSFPELAVEGEASYDNVDISVQRNDPEIEVREGGVELVSHPNAPEVEYIRGKLEMYMVQYHSVDITPPTIDTRL